MITVWNKCAAGPPNHPRPPGGSPRGYGYHEVPIEIRFMIAVIKKIFTTILLSFLITFLLHTVGPIRRDFGGTLLLAFCSVGFLELFVDVRII